MKAIVLSLFLTFSFSAMAAQGEFLSAQGPVLIIGDSMTKGDLGQYLHQMIAKQTGRQVTSIGVGGAGSASFVASEIVNNCCGYRIRENAAGGPVEIIERDEDKDFVAVGQKYNGSLSAMLEDIKPGSVLIVLGTNQVNAHAKLIGLIRSAVPNAVIAWAGPPLLSTSDKIYSKLEAALSGLKPSVQLIRADQFGIGDADETMVHYAGKTAATFAADIIARLK